MKGNVRIEVLGGFRTVLPDRAVEADAWPTRRAQELVALLALAEGRRLPRDHVIEQLWPHLTADAGAANLRKAAHHARRVLDSPEAVVLRGGSVHLLPDHDVEVDAPLFLREADRALATADAQACAAVAATCVGQVLPDSPYEIWAQDARRQVHARLTALLGRAGDWERLLEIEPTDEGACRELMQEALDDGRRHVAIRWYERLRIALVRELGVQPGDETRALYERCTAGVRLGEPSFVGRAADLEEAAGVRAGVATGGTAALLVTGTSGIGKSALCRRIVAAARTDGWRTISVTDTGSGTPYGPIAQALEQLLVDGREALEALPARTRSILAALSPAAAPADPLQGAMTRHQVVAAFRRALTLGGDFPPTVLVVEDAHLLDEATAGALHQLVAGGAEDPLLVVLACRSEWLRTSLPEGLTELAAGPRTRTLALGPLDDAHVAELVATTAPVQPAPEVVGRVVAVAEGSPLFALELARAVSADATDALPATVRQAIGLRLAGLDASTLDVLTSLAVTEDELALDSILALTGLPEDAAFAALDAALHFGVLVVSGTHYRFRHELVRRALIDDLAPHHRVLLHRGAAERLTQTSGAPELIAAHWLKGERPHQAVPWLLEAARRAVAVGAFVDALAQVDRLVTHEPDHHDGLCLRAEILDALGDGRAPAAYAAAAEAVGEPESHELRARQALAQLKASNPDSALKTLEGVRPVTTIGKLAEALTLSAAAAIGRYADADTAAAKADVAHKLAMELGDPGFILDATWAHALAAHAKGELPSRLREYLRATQDLPELATRVFDGQLCVTERMLYGGLPNAEIIAFADELATEASRIGAARGHAFALTLRGEAGILAGRLDEAEHDFSEGARLHGRIGAVAGEALSLLGQAQVAIQRGHPEHARPYLADALRMARESEVGHHTLDRIYGAMVEAAPDPATGVQRIADAETAIQGPAETCPTCRIAFIVPATIAAARAGDMDRAHHYAAACETALEIVALPPAWHAAVAEARGWVARAEGQDGDARGHFEQAAEGFHTWDQPLDGDRCAQLAAG